LIPRKGSTRWTPRCVSRVWEKKMREKKKRRMRMRDLLESGKG